MNKLRFALTISLATCLLFNHAYAQQPSANDTRKAELSTLSQQFGQLYQTRKQQITDLSAKHNWVLHRRRKDGGLTSLQSINRLGFPVYFKTDNNTTAAATTHTNLVQPGGSLNLNLSGSSTALNNKLAIWDAGSVYAGHQEFAGKTITLKNASSAIQEHSTHVAGTMIAKGVLPAAKGMAFGANTLQSYDFDNDLAEMSAAASTLLLSNHSYGQVAGWDFNDDQNRWEWYGLPGDTVDYNFGFYDDRAQSWDNIAYKAPYYLIVESAGNNRDYTGPDVGADYWGFKSRTDQTFVDKGPRPATISSNNGYDIIPDYANAKNILTVGAVNPLPFGPVNRSDVSIAFFSSWGPTDDGRIKPDICGMGVNVLSTTINGPNSYGILSGTSMSSPNVTGSLYLLQEYYSKLNAGAFMRSATLKGLACGTAFDSGNVGPDYIYGWGLLDMQKAAQAITDNGTKSLIKENTLTQGQTQNFNVTASGSGQFTATISWTDPQGVLSPEGTINSRTPKLVNDLDIRVSDGTSTFLPWVLNPDQPAAAASNGDNIRDNIEQIYIAGAVPGRNYSITVSHKKTLQSGSQAYSLIVTGIGGTAYCASAPLSNADSRIDKFTLANIQNTPAAGCTTYSDYTGLTAQLEPGKTYPLSLTLGTCGNNFNKIAKVFVDWNGDGDFDDANELIATSGVVSATNVFTANITVPRDVIIGNFSRLRLVLTETTDPAAVTACGTYAKGETQDYRVQFIQPATDAGITAINSTSAGLCAGKTNLTVTIRNFGTATLTNIPVSIAITAPDNTVTTINETFTGSLAPGSEADYTFTGTLNALAGANYSVTGATNIPEDLAAANNQLTVTLAIGTVPVAGNLSASHCSNTNSYQLSGSADGTLLWYKNIGDTAPIAAGSSTSTTTAPVNNTYYVGVNDFVGTVGPASKSAFTGGGYNQFTPAINVTTKAPLIIESARLYIGNSGKITFSVEDSNGQIVSTTTIDAVATRSTPAAGVAPDDPTDPGKVYILNLIFPAAGSYSINISYDANATIYRNNTGVTGYPFTVGNIFSIIGTNADPGPLTYYYYLYDIHLRSYGCPSATRQAVSVTRPVVTQNGKVLSSNYATGNQWYYNGAIIAGATGQTYSPVQSGNYQVQVTLSGSCTDISDNFAFALTALHPDNSTDIGLVLFPVPASGTLNVLFKAPAAGNLIMAFINAAGQTLRTENRTVNAGNYSTLINVSTLIPGTYVLKLTLGDKVYAKKVIIIR